ncbi:TolC family protein [Fontibacter flavus]|uniref:TolC family protein n=1 Tax=Fontibacter flavus TaxID=654838 RepID=A0ABV6FP74_9BACT
MRKNIRTQVSVLMTLVLFIFQGCKTAEISQENQNLRLQNNYDVVNVDTSATAAELHWESYFEDEALKTLIRIALENNQDHLKALERMRVAKASFNIAKVGMLPEISGMAGASNRKFGEYTMDGVGNFDSNLSPTVPEDKRIPDPYKDFIIGAGFNWELDVWGKYRNQKRAAAARFLASQEMANYVKTLLISDVAIGYYMLVGLDEEINILEENIQLQELAFNLSKDLKESGKENQLAVDQFESLLLNSKALFVEKQRERRSAELYLSGLLGIYQPENERTTLDAALNSQDLVKVGLPAELLRFRPDIKMAEQELLASKADVGAARAAFFPSINLFGMAGFNAFDFSKLFFNPASTAYQIGSGLTAPIFNRNQIRMSFEAANANQKVAWYEYEQVVLKSYLEILDLVNQFEAYQMQVQMKTSEVEVQKRSVENSNIMFTVGYANYLEVINAQSRALTAQIELVELKIQQLQSRVQLYRALGGGWI